MKEELCDLIEESVRLELNVAELYLLCHNAFPADADFWWKLVLEEKNHAALIRSIGESFMPAGIMPVELLSPSLARVREANAAVARRITRFRTAPPSREEAFGIARRLEESAGEVHYQAYMEKKKGSKIDEIFQNLNRADKDHASRIRSYMEGHGIKWPEETDDSAQGNAIQPGC